jgi:hypothetical protein
MTSYAVKLALEGFFSKWKSTNDMTLESFKRVNTNLYVRTYLPLFMIYVQYEADSMEST